MLGLRRCMSFPLFNIFLSSGDDQRRKTVKKKKKKQGVLLHMLYIRVCAWVGSGSQGVFTLPRGKTKREKKGLRRGNCDSWWPRRTFMKKNSGEENIQSSPKLQLDCGPCSSAPYKESLSHKPTQAEETWAEGGTERASMWANKRVFTSKKDLQAEDEHILYAASWNPRWVIAE